MALVHWLIFQSLYRIGAPAHTAWWSGRSSPLLVVVASTFRSDAETGKPERVGARLLYQWRWSLATLWVHDSILRLIMVRFGTIDADPDIRIREPHAAFQGARRQSRGDRDPGLVPPTNWASEPWLFIRTRVLRSTVQGGRVHQIGDIGHPVRAYRSIEIVATYLSGGCSRHLPWLRALYRWDLLRHARRRRASVSSSQRRSA